MSHFTKVELELEDREALIHAFMDLGFQDIRAGGEIRGFRGQRTWADLVVRQDRGFDIGVRQHPGRLEVIADWAGIEGGEEAFMAKLRQAYAARVIRKTVGERGHRVTEQHTLPSGDVILKVRIPEEAKITVHRSGETTVEGTGFTGPECISATRPLEEALGRVVEERQLKPEYHRKSSASAASGATTSLGRRQP